MEREELKRSMPMRVTAALAVLTMTILSFQNCDNVKLSLIPQPTPAPLELPSEVPASLFGDLEPVLAVRNTGCLMCHAKIDGDLITDLGAGDRFVMGTDGIEFHPKQKDYYSPFRSKHFIWDSNTWETSAVMGNIYVPNEVIRDERLIKAHEEAGNITNGPLTIYDFVRLPFLNPNMSGGPRVVSLIPKTNSPDINVPGLRGDFIAKNKIWIDAPTASEVIQLERGETAETMLARPGLVVTRSSKEDYINGLSAVQSHKTQRLGLVNDGIVECRGDIIIDGTVLLKNLKLKTDDKGCRLYVTRTVFIQGPIEYLTGGDSNLQISSARAIIMGIASLTPRFTQEWTQPTVGGTRAAWSDDEELSMNEDIFNDRDDLNGITNDAGPWRLMVDRNGTPLAYMDDADKRIWLPAPGVTSFPDPATCKNASRVLPSDPQPCAQNWAGEFPGFETQLRKTINYKHLLLNAPKIHSRYLGTFEGVVIGEDVLFAVHNFAFKKDPVMFRVPLLPLVKDRVFKME